MSEIADRSPRVRGIWKDAGPPLSQWEAVAAEVGEAFGPVREWRRLSWVEQAPDLYSLVLDTLLTLSWWGWAIDVTRGQGRWTITAARAVDGRNLRAKVIGATYADAVWQLGEKLDAALEHEEKAA